MFGGYYIVQKESSARLRDFRIMRPKGSHLMNLLKFSLLLQFDWSTGTQWTDHSHKDGLFSWKYVKGIGGITTLSMAAVKDVHFLINVFTLKCFYERQHFILCDAVDLCCLL